LSIEQTAIGDYDTIAIEGKASARIVEQRVGEAIAVGRNRYIPSAKLESHLAASASDSPHRVDRRWR